MSGELEAGALGSVGGLSKGAGDGDLSGDPCRNCGTVVTGRYCGNCGQLAQTFHRPIWSLASEVLGDFLSLDGRVMRTLPSLMLRPGRVTREYLTGKRQRFVPPFRLYLLTSFIYFVMLFAYGDSQGWFDIRYINQETPVTIGATPPEGMSEEEMDAAMEQAQEALDDAGVPVDIEVVGNLDAISNIPAEQGQGVIGENTSSRTSVFREDGRVNRDDILDNLRNSDDFDDDTKDFLAMVVGHVADAYENQGMFFASIQNWAPRIALALTPAMILLLTIVYPFSKRIYIYDHVIVSLHFQSWYYILLSVAFLFFWLGLDWFVFVLFIAPPIYIYRMLREVYSSGRILSLLRTGFILFSLTLMVQIFFVILVIVGAFEVTPVAGGLS
ncbi:DUF3667 domain-containing protein [Ponticaulis koreensis]|uniref:DUF3667 domain-containing protein n=1 Tax=Ponticaulis koreensis TaxID=1123045 RepID=UPI0003B6D7B4|nr:DUF3667 domain-containing protein [Ponticaulis koreensis]